MKPAPWGLRIGALSILVVSSIRCDNGIGRNDFRCESAMAHLADCCPDFPLNPDSCETVGSGCQYDSLPVLESEESTCIMARSCDDIRAQGICEAVLNLPVGTARCIQADLCQDGGVVAPLVCQ